MGVVSKATRASTIAFHMTWLGEGQVDSGITQLVVEACYLIGSQTRPELCNMDKSLLKSQLLVSLGE